MRADFNKARQTVKFGLRKRACSQIAIKYADFVRHFRARWTPGLGLVCLAAFLDGLRTAMNIFPAR
jgi:hypothetical protein